MLFTVLILILLLVTNWPQSLEVPLSARAVPEDYCFISDFVSFTKILNKEVSPCQQRNKS